MKQKIKEEIKIALWSLLIFILMIGAIYFFNDPNDFISRNSEKVAEMLRGGS